KAHFGGLVAGGVDCRHNFRAFLFCKAVSHDAFLFLSKGKMEQGIFSPLTPPGWINEFRLCLAMLPDNWLVMPTACAIGAVLLSFEKDRLFRIPRLLAWKSSSKSSLPSFPLTRRICSKRRERKM